MRAGDPLITHRGLIYRFVLTTLWLLYSVYFRQRVRGRENLPEGRALIVSNHQSGLDIPLIAMGLPRHLAFIGRDNLADFKPLGWVMKRCGAILIARGKRDRGALDRAAEHLRAEDAVVIFAEGTRTRTGQLGRFRKGALFTARMGEAPMVPTVVRGSYRAMPPGAWFPRPVRLELEFLPPVDPMAPDALEQVRLAIATALGEDVAPQPDLLHVPLDARGGRGSREEREPSADPAG